MSALPSLCRQCQKSTFGNAAFRASSSARARSFSGSQALFAVKSKSTRRILSKREAAVKEKRRSMAAAKVEAGKESLPLNEAIKVLRSTEVAYPNTAYHLFVKTQVGNGVAVPKGRITWPRDAKPKAEETIVVFAEGKQAGDAKRAGATKVGGMELVEDILNSKVRPTTVLCTSALIKPITPKLGRFLGPMGLMPSTRRGTVTDDVGGYIRRLQGSSEWRADKTGNIRTAVAMMHFPANDVVKNFRHFIQSLKEATGHVADKSSSARRNKAASPKPVTPILRVLLGSKHGPTIRISDAL